VPSSLKELFVESTLGKYWSFSRERLGCHVWQRSVVILWHLLIWRMTRASTTERKPASIPSPIEATWTSTVKAASRPSIESFYYCLPSPPATFCDALPAAQAFCAPPLPISLWPGSRLDGSSMFHLDQH